MLFSFIAGRLPDRAVCERLPTEVGNNGDVTLTGSNSYTGGTFIGDNNLILGDNSTPGSGAIAGNVQFVNNFLTVDDNPRTITFNRVDDFTFSGNITTNFTSAQNNLGIVQLNGSATVTLTGTNTYGGGTVINAGILRVGNGGTRGSVGTGNIVVTTELDFNRSDSVTIGAVISGAGSLVQLGAGTLTLTNANTYAGATVVSNGKHRGHQPQQRCQAVGTAVHNTGILGGAGTFNGGPVTLDAPGTTLAPGIAAVRSRDSRNHDDQQRP